MTGLVSRDKNGVARTLTSRNISCVSSFLKIGQGTLDQISNDLKKQLDMLDEDASDEAYDLMICEEHLIDSPDIEKLQQLRDVLYKKWVKDGKMILFEFYHSDTDLHDLLAELKLSGKHLGSGMNHHGNGEKWLNPFYERQKRERE